MRAHSPAGDGAVRQALVLAAGQDDRFQHPARESKLLQPVLGRPLIVRTIETARDAGLEALEIVLGYQAERVHAAIQRHAPPNVQIHFTYNPYWDLENGISVLAARGRLPSRFALLMGDHLFESGVLRQLLRVPTGPDESVLAVDSRPTTPEVAAEATKVQIRGCHITAIGKALTAFDALDTGMSVCAPSLFPALVSARNAGDATLSGGIRILAGRGLMRAFDIGDAMWCDIDTIEDLQRAESLLGADGALGAFGSAMTGDTRRSRPASPCSSVFW